MYGKENVVRRCVLILLAALCFFFGECPVQAAPAKAPAKVAIKTVSSASEGKLKVTWKKFHLYRDTRYKLQKILSLQRKADKSGICKK